MNRRNVLRWLALATVGALLGAGTSALLSDSETSASQSFSDGTLDLVLGGTAQSARINVLDRKPGDSDPAAAQLTLSNNGSLPGTLTLKVLQTADPDNTCTEPEDLAEDGDGIAPHEACGAEGELDAHLNVTLTSGSDTWTGTLDGIHDVLRSLGTLGASGSATDSRTLTIGWDIPGPTTGNDVQSDGATFVIEAHLNQVVGVYLSGPQVNVEQSTLTGWTVCYSDTHAHSGTPLATILSQCDGANLMLASGPVGSTVFDVVAAAPRADVLFDTGVNQTTTHNANGTEWYFNGGWSWGFAKGGDAVYKNSADVNDSGLHGGTAVGPNGIYRLSWHTGGNSISTGWRSGSNVSLNFNSGFRRVILESTP